MQLLSETGQCPQTRQFVFTEWDPTAGSDLEALASVFGSDGGRTIGFDEHTFESYAAMVIDPVSSVSTLKSEEYCPTLTDGACIARICIRPLL